MSALTDAFEDLLDAQEEACGERITATVGSVTADALIGDTRYVDSFVNGGVSEAGGIEIRMRVSDFDEPPEQAVDTVTLSTGSTWDLDDYSESHGIYTFTLDKIPAKDG